MASAKSTSASQPREVDFPIFDADNHFYETPDALTKYLPPDRYTVVTLMPEAPATRTQ